MGNLEKIDYDVESDGKALKGQEKVLKVDGRCNKRLMERR